MWHIYTMDKKPLTIAIVEDEDNLRESLSFALKREGYNVEEFSNGGNALKQFREQLPDFILSDIMMPVLDGLELLKAVRSFSNDIPFMFLTSKDEEFDRILGLEIGADDYLCKPFSLRELITRIKVILRRYQKGSSTLDSLYKNGGLKINLQTYTAELNGSSLNITVTEFRLLEVMMSHLDVVKTREQLIAAAYPEDNYISDRNVDCHIKRLRKKISSVDPHYKAIVSVYGVGYKMVKL